ncbi:MAG: hypothetical protein IT521_10645 [Burkholderiales bacterium]|nr:hypothetical protein [Burkholderiales bacterium]
MTLSAALRAVVLACVGLVTLMSVSAAVPVAPSTAAPPTAWPRELALAGATARVYPPQVTRWAGGSIDFRAPIAIKPAGAGDETVGVLFVTARTHVDRVTRTVVLDDFRITRSEFPALPDRGAAYVDELAKRFGSAVRTVSLERLELSLAAGGASTPTVAVRNDPPRVIVANVPSILIPIDGKPAWKPVPGSAGFQRVVNTRALILKSSAAPEVFLRVYDGWLMANTLEGPWTQPLLAPQGIDAVAKKIAANGVVDLLDGGPGADPKPSLAKGIPAIVTSEVPAELVEFHGAPDFVPVVGTGLHWAANTTRDVLRDVTSGAYYVLLAGRWFRSTALTGPWTFVASNALPADFARIPPASLAGAVLPAVAGTTPAREAAIANTIAQTATVPLKNGPKFTARFDGVPQFAAIPGTSLSYATNAAVPVIQSGPAAFHAVNAGVWFTAPAATGPWTIATSVPSAIYSIPPESPIFYVTFVHIYGATADAVFEGYTPGYLGAMIAPTGTVVFGTGYAYPSWIGNAWYPSPVTYGVAAMPVFNRYVGYSYGFAMGLATADWTPGKARGVSLHPGYWGAYPCCGTTSANVYRYWGRVAAAQSGRKGAPGGSPKGAAVVSAATAPPAPAPAASRGYDMTMITSADSGNPGPVVVGSNAPPTPAYISANAYYASLGESPPAPSKAAGNDVYADAAGHVYRHDGHAWQRQQANGWTAEPAPPAGAVAETQARDRATQAALQAGSFGMSNTTRFSGNRGDGWTARDAGSGGYSRTLGGSGGISAEAWNYNDAVMNNEFDIAANGGWWSQGVYIGGFGWGGRYGGVVP